MEWWLIITIFILVLFILLILKLPVAIGFLITNLIFAYVFWKGAVGVQQITLSIYYTVGSFVISPLLMFVIMGQILFHSGMAYKAIDVINKLLGRLPGRLGIVTIASGTLFSALSGSSTGSTAMLGTALTPEMEKRGYHKQLSIGTVIGSGGLAVIVPPSAPAIILGALAEVSVGSILIAGIFPGLLMALFYTLYVVGICVIKPSMAPSYPVPKTSLSDKLKSIVTELLPFGIIILAVTGAIFLGVATPTESAALGATASIILAICYKKASWALAKDAIIETIRVAVMVFFIMGGAIAFSQILGSTGATQGMITAMTSINAPPVILVAIMMVIVLFLGTYMDGLAILMLTIPIFMPIVSLIGYPEVTFCVLMLISTEVGLTTPPFGLNLFVMMAVLKESTPPSHIYKAALPFILTDVIALVLVMLLPQISLFLPEMMR